MENIQYKKLLVNFVRGGMDPSRFGRNGPQWLLYDVAETAATVQV